MEITSYNRTCEHKEIIGKELWSAKIMIFFFLDIFIAILAVILNSLVIFVFFREKVLRRRINYYIISLAFADFFAGAIGIPLELFSVSFKDI